MKRSNAKVFSLLKIVESLKEAENNNNDIDLTDTPKFYHVPAHSIDGNYYRKLKRKETLSGFEKWLVELFETVMELAEMHEDEIAITGEEVLSYYRRGISPGDVYFKEWGQDAGNFFAF